MDDGGKPGLRSVRPGEEPPSEGHSLPAHELARQFLAAAEDSYSGGDHESADVLAAIGLGWATLALTEPRP